MGGTQWKAATVIDSTFYLANQRSTLRPWLHHSVVQTLLIKLSRLHRHLYKDISVRQAGMDTLNIP
jgi:predicted kinase